MLHLDGLAIGRLALIGMTAIGTAVVRGEAAGAGGEPPPLKPLGNAITEFGASLTHQANAAAANYFVSPYSVHAALSMTLAGARGQTAQQMQKVLQLDSVNNVAAANQALQKHLQAARDKGGFELNIANALWSASDASFEADFTRLIAAQYGGGLKTVEFTQSQQATRTINQWVSEQTHQKIPELIPAGVLGRDTRLVLTNAIYFKAPWTSPFSPEATQPGDFHATGADGAAETVRVDLMHQTGEHRYFEDGELQAVELSYGRGDEAMLVLLPRNPAGIGAIQKSLSADRIDKIVAGLKSRQVRLTLPKFALRYRVDLAKTLSQMGMTDAFDTKADFSGMSLTEKLLISNVIHEAFVDVNEEGTEAAGATAVVMMRMSMPIGAPAEFTADHPFCFLIRDRQSGTTLFMGTLAKPQAKAK